MVPTVEEPTGLVLTVKVALVLPAGTVTLAGTVAAPVLLLDKLTTAPPLGAGALSVTVPVEELPPVTLDGLRLSEESVGGAGVTEGEGDGAVALEELEMVAEVAVVVGLVDGESVALRGKVAVAGTLATPGLLLDRLTTAPPLGAGPLSVTVPVEELPPVTLVGLRLSDESVGGAGATVSEADRVVPL